ncbi:bacillithiol biosynthesis cysteine-adding enzyme BshC [Paenibacillus daejeonensis]|uniref:bacillithiol biosynthesis cysteine-adding enzyme BshC n=1 Tax=Paenibacillus daejeonensis TaxID=135193 RepID=UPI00037497D2|nr:bacillithiol biosynthesis cysteine-adding enzyme BshC [Paenibacillus daejeonensis]
MKTQVLERSPGSTLTDAYVHRTDSRIEGLFPYHPQDERDWERRASYLDSRASERVDAIALAAVLENYNRRNGASAQTMEAISRVADGALVIVGGQQAGLWGGPLMILHKAVTVINAARDAQQRLRRPVVPVFWIAGEDHDWEEACHTYLPGEGGLQKLAIARPAGPRTSVSRTPVEQAIWTEQLGALATLLPDTLHKPGLIRQLEAMAARSVTLSELLASVLSWLFANEGLVLLDADDPELRRLESPMLQRMLVDNRQLEESFRSVSDDVEAWGYKLQAEAETDSANLFYYRKDVRAPGAGERTKLYRTEQGFADRRGLIRLSTAEAIAAAAAEPEQFSNNVLSRPMMQDYVLPVLATVLGPGEIGYWGITGRAFQVMGMEMPIVVPRMSFTLIDETTAKHMEKYALTIEDVMFRFEEFRDTWLAAQDRDQLGNQFDVAEQQMLALYDPLLKDVAARMPGLAALTAKNRELFSAHIAFMRRRVDDELKRKHEVSLNQLERIRLMLYPGGIPQERVLNFTLYWNKYGGDWLQQLLRIPFDPSGKHRLVYL